jgi:diguanylate cyclase (GGDEF)-like protein/PAS domain S-box-containing protein
MFRVLAAALIALHIGLLHATPIERHPLEVRAITAPQAALKELTMLQAKAVADGDFRTIALLELARANACRILADWSCQQRAGISAQNAAEKIEAPELLVRAMIVQSRSSAAMQDFSRAESAASGAEQLLQKHPHPELLAELMLAYSSISFALGRTQSSLEYTKRGDALFVQADPAQDIGTRVRLLRNQARAQIVLGNQQAARDVLKQALAINQNNDDPKLAAELHLEAARLARATRDLSSQRASTEAVTQLAAKLKNTQLYGQALEVQGLTELDMGQEIQAFKSLTAAYNDLVRIEHRRDALRVLRELLPLSFRIEAPANDIRKLSTELVSLQSFVDQDEKTLAAANFDARLLYAQREFELKRLNDQNAAFAAQEKLLRRNQGLAITIAALCASLLLGALAFVYFQLQAKRRLQESRSRLQSVTESIPAEIAQVDRELRYLFVNNLSAQQMATSGDQLLGHSLIDTAIRRDKQRLAEMAGRALQGETVSFEEKIENADGTQYFETVFVPDYAGKSTTSPGQPAKGFFSLRFDISRLKHAENKLAHMAHCDSMTGLANRRHFDERIESAVKRAQHENTSITVLAIDIDHFKLINDECGHLTGDAVIKRVAQLITANLRHSDLVARIGGDEFLVLLEGAPNSQIGVNAAQKLQTAMRAITEIDHHPINAQISIGIAHAVAPVNAHAVLHAADQALYETKRNGRNSYRLREISAAAKVNNVVELRSSNTNDAS